jgi:hypothetical protein
LGDSALDDVVPSEFLPTTTLCTLVVPETIFMPYIGVEFCKIVERAVLAVTPDR